MKIRDTRKGRGRSSRDDSKRSTLGARKPRLDSSRAPKKTYRPGFASTLRRQGGSVFSDVVRVKDRVNEETSSDSDFNAIASGGFRLQQVLAAAGYGSRRQCETLIADGRVEVDGRTVTELGVRVKPGEQKIRVDGENLPKVKPVYVAFNKPKNTLCTNRDPQGRRRVADFIPGALGRLFPVGRLDQNSEGLILLTNDGALAQRLTHPSYETPKKYRVQVAGSADYELVEALKRGVHIAEGVVQADDVTIRSSRKNSSILEITLTEGKNREIRRMLARVGHKVMQLQRVQVGSIKLGKLAPGEFRRLTSAEVADLYRLASPPRAKERDEKTRDQAPIEVSALEEREAEKAAARSDAKALEREQARAAARDPNFSAAVRRQLRREYGGGSDRAATEGVREERRSRRDRDDEVRTIGAKKFSREEDERSDYLAADESELRRARRRRNFRRDEEAFGERSARASQRGGAKERKTPRQPRGGRATRGGRGR